MQIKLYRFANGRKDYWVAWEDDGDYTAMWGELGKKGEMKTFEGSWFRSGERDVVKEADAQRAAGFAEIDDEQQATLLVEYAITGMGTAEDLDKRHRLQEALDEALAWTALGYCDGGSIGSGTMEACCYVVDFELGRRVIADALRGTEFGNYTRIYDENAG